MTIAQALWQGRHILRSVLEADILIAYVIGKPREFIMAHPEVTLAKPLAKRFFDYCARRKSGIPLAYLTNHKEFFGLDFFVDERVLIPRPETEHLVSEVFSLAGEFKIPRILDTGTGSGCIAISLALSLPKAKITASDISKDALSIARKNVRAHRVSRQIRLVRGDLLKPFIDSRFDIIVANLPYVPRRESHLVEKEVKKHEPKSALWGGQDGLKFLRQFLHQVKNLAHPPRYVLCEFGFSMKKDVQKLIESIFKNSHVVYKKDLSRRDRYFILQLCGKN